MNWKLSERTKYQTIPAVALLAFALVFAYSAGADITYEDAVRASAKRLQSRREDCVAATDPAVCRAIANAEWRKAMALAEARRKGTKEAWKDADQVIREEDERLRLLIGRKTG